MALLHPENLQKMQERRKRFHSMHKTDPTKPPQAIPAPKIEIPPQHTTPEPMPGKLVKMPPYEFYIHFEDRLKSN